MTRSLLRNSRAYTLIELLVVITIIGILLTISYTGLRGATDQEVTRSAALGIRNNLRSAQEKSQSSTLNAAGVPADQYGLLVTTTSYQVIRIDKGNQITSPTVVSVINLPAGTTISSTPTGLKYVTFSKNKALVQFYDANGAIIAPDVDGSMTITVLGNGSYVVKIFRDTGRIE